MRPPLPGPVLGTQPQAEVHHANEHPAHQAEQLGRPAGPDASTGAVAAASADDRSPHVGAAASKPEHLFGRATAQRTPAARKPHLGPGQATSLFDIAQPENHAHTPPSHTPATPPSPPLSQPPSTLNAATRPRSWPTAARATPDQGAANDPSRGRPSVSKNKRPSSSARASSPGPWACQSPACGPRRSTGRASRAGSHPNPSWLTTRLARHRCSSSPGHTAPSLLAPNKLRPITCASRPPIDRTIHWRRVRGAEWIKGGASPSSQARGLHRHPASVRSGRQPAARPRSHQA